MKKQITFFLCCIAFVLSGLAQTTVHNFSEKSTEFANFEKFIINNNPAKEIFASYQQHTSLSPMPISTKLQYGDDWWEPDTIYFYSIFGDKARYIFSYENGKSILFQLEKFNQWENYMMITYTYNTQGNMNECIIRDWKSNQWVNSGRHSCTYDVQNKLTEILVQNWQSNKWTNSNREIYTYNTKDNLTEWITQDWESGKWVNFFKGFRTYDTLNNVVETLFQIWQSSQWVNIDKFSNTYDIQNRMIVSLAQRWQSGQWVNSWKDSTTYNEQNNMVELLTQSWASVQWVNSRKNSYIYNAQNNMVEDLYQYWSSEEWANYWRFEYEYDENNNSNFGLFQLWQNSTWVDSDTRPEYLALFSLNYNNKQSECGNYFHGHSSEISSYIYSRCCHKVTVSYIKTGSTGIKESYGTENPVKLYPNPVSNILYIETNNTNTVAEVKIYSTQGVLLIDTKGKQVDVSSLSSGIYIARIDGVHRKFIKQ